jgi:hypothetical protein
MRAATSPLLSLWAALASFPAPSRAEPIAPCSTSMPPSPRRSGVIAECTRLALAAKKAAGARLGNHETSMKQRSLGRHTLAIEADQLAANLL